jgi:hypothetical protein
MTDYLQEKLYILQKFDIEDVVEHISLNELKRIEKKIEIEIENKNLLQKYFKNCNTSITEQGITEITLDSKLVREIFNLRNYSEFKGDWDSDNRYWDSSKQQYQKIGRFHTVLDDHLDSKGYPQVYMYIEINEGEFCSTVDEFKKRVDKIYNNDNNAITCQLRDKCVIIYLDWHREHDIW